MSTVEKEKDQYPVPAAAVGVRFDKLARDVGEVFMRHGLPRPRGAVLASLEETLFEFVTETPAVDLARGSMEFSEDGS